MLACATFSQIFASLSWGHESYQMTEWLINYAGGFVRRGLPGEIIARLSEATGIRANYLVIATSLSCYLALVIWFLRASTRVFPAALIISSIVMGFPAYQDSIIRKDCFGVMLLLSCLKAEASSLPRPWVICIVNLLASIAILSHEAFVFYAIPAFILFQRTQHSSQDFRSIVRRSLSLLPTTAVFLFAICHHGTPEIARAVHESWMPLWQSIDPSVTSVTTPDASIEGLGWTTSQGLSLSIYMLSHGLYQPLAWAMVFIISFVLVLLYTGNGKNADPANSMQMKVRIAALLVAQLLFISPLFLLGVDYGRWLFFWVASSIILQTLHWKAPNWLESATFRVFDKMHLSAIFERIPVRDWYLLFFGVPVCWNLYNFITAAPLIRHLDILRNSF